MKNIDSGVTCFHCLRNSVIWDCDYEFSDFGYDGKGVVQILHCENCGAEIEYRIRLDDNEEDKAEKEDKELLVEKIRKLQTYKLAPELEKLVSLEHVIAILEGEEEE